MNRIAVFPYDENFYPLLKNSESMVGFEISKVFSIRGWGYVGRNIFDVSDTTSRNIHVEDISSTCIFLEVVSETSNIFLPTYPHPRMLNTLLISKPTILSEFFNKG